MPDKPLTPDEALIATIAGSFAAAALGKLNPTQRASDFKEIAKSSVTYAHSLIAEVQQQTIVRNQAKAQREEAKSRHAQQA